MANIYQSILEKKKMFWTDGYFICSIGNVIEKQLRKYIENQG